MGLFIDEALARDFPQVQAILSDSRLMRVLSDQAVQELLFALSTQVHFLTTGQVQDWLWAYPGDGFLRHRADPTRTIHSVRIFKKLVRSILEQLESAGLIRSESVKHLPPLTISDTPIITRETHPALRQEFPVEEAPCCIELARRRVPPMESHAPSKLYFVLDKTIDLMRCLHHKKGGNKKVWIRERVTQVKAVLDEHWAVERRRTFTSLDIAQTNLVASYNLNRFLFMERYRSGTSPSFDTFEISGAGRDGYDGKVRLRDGRKVVVFFLRPCGLEQLCANVTTCSKGYALECDEVWWM